MIVGGFAKVSFLVTRLYCGCNTSHVSILRLALSDLALQFVTIRRYRGENFISDFIAPFIAAGYATRDE